MRPRRVRRFWRPRLEQLEDRRVLACDAFVREQTLFVHGDERNNAVEIVGIERGVLVTCDGQSQAFQGIADVEAELGGGDDTFTIDNRNGLLGGIAIQVFGQEGDDGYTELLGNLPTSGIGENGGGIEFGGGAGKDSFTLQAASSSELIEYLDVPETPIVDRRIRVTDSVRNQITFDGIVADTEKVTIESEGGDDVFDVAVPPPADTEITLGGQSQQSPLSHRLFKVFEVLATGDRAAGTSQHGRIPGKININSVWGEDSLIVFGDRNPDLFKTGPGATPDLIKIILSDITGALPVEINGVGVESLAAVGGAGEDHFDVMAPLPTDVIVFDKAPGASPLQATLFIAKQQALRDRAPYGVRLIEGQELTIIGSDLAEEFDIRPGQVAGSTHVEMTDRTTGILLARANVDVGTLTAKGGDGDDTAMIDNSEGLLNAIKMLFLGEGANDAAAIGALRTVVMAQSMYSEGDKDGEGAFDYDGGDGFDTMTFFATNLDERIRVAADRAGQTPTVEIRASLAATGEETLPISARGIEEGVIKGRDGDDEFRVEGPLPTVLHLFGEGGDDVSVCIGGNELLSDTPWPFDGGDGHDTFTLVTSDRDELIEIVGVELDELPDPVVRITDLETNLLRKVISLVEFEEFELDDPGGDNKVVMREEGAPLSDINWTISTGAGNDKLDVLMGAIPDVFNVQTVGGDDGVNVVFADGQFSPPREPGAPAPEIVVDVGAGINSVMLDVFGSLRPQPPSDLGREALLDEPAVAPGDDISIQVTLVEVLAAIFVQGVGMLDLLALFPLGALNMRQAVQDDRAGDTRSEVAMRLDGPDVIADVTTGATLDSILIDLAPQAESQVLLKVDTGGGDDRLHEKIVSIDLSRATTGGMNIRDDYALGSGDDVLIIESVVGAGQHDYEIDMGSGDDEVVGSVLPAAPEGVDYVLDWSWASDLGAGDDRIELELPAAHAEQILHDVQIDGGGGDDQVTVSVPAVQTDGLADLIVGADRGTGPHVKVFDGGTNAEGQSFFAYPPSFSGGVRVAAGDVNGDGVADIITGAGPGAGTHVKVFNGATNELLQSFFAYPGFAGGVYVAAGDVNGDGRADIVTGADSAAPHVKVFDGASGAEIRSFFAFGGFQGGVRVAAGDVNADGFDDIVVAVGPGAGPHVKVFDGQTNAELASFFAYGPGFLGGVYVAAGDVDGDGRADIVTGAGAGSVPHVKVFSGANFQELRSFLAYGPNFTGGVRVAAGDVNGDGFVEIVTGAGPGAGPHVKVFDGKTNAEVRSFFAFDPSFTGGVFVASGDLHASSQLFRYQLDLVIETHGGADSVAVHLGAAATEERIEKVRVSTGVGLDTLQFDVFAPADPCLFEGDYGIETGGDDDTVNFALRTAPGQATGPNGPEPQELNIKTQINTDGGNDKLHFDWLVHTDRQLVSVMELFTVGGHDLSSFKISEVVVPRPRERVFHHYNFFHDSGTGQDTVEMSVAGMEMAGQSRFAIHFAPDNLGDVLNLSLSDVVVSPGGQLAIATNLGGPDNDFTSSWDHVTNAGTIDWDVTIGRGATRFKPLFAFYIEDLDGKFNLNQNFRQGSGQTEFVMRDSVLGGTWNWNYQGGTHDQLLHKTFDRVTVRSNVFAVWLTVGFFEVIDESKDVSVSGILNSTVTGGPGSQLRTSLEDFQIAAGGSVSVQMHGEETIALPEDVIIDLSLKDIVVGPGARLDLGAEIGRGGPERRHRFFAIVDRTKLGTMDVHLRGGAQSSAEIDVQDVHVVGEARFEVDGFTETNLRAAHWLVEGIYHLQLGGTNAANLFGINFEDVEAVGTEFSGVDLDAGGGNDVVVFEFSSNIRAESFHRFGFDLGAGNDTFRGNWVFGTELPRVQVNEQMAVDISVDGQQGNDNIVMNWVELVAPLRTPFGARRQTLLDLDGGHGNDNISLDFRGAILNGEAVDAVIRGGGGEDAIRALFQLDPWSTGRLKAEVHGEGGDDDLALEIFGADNLAELLALLDGGLGRDRAKVTPNVVVKGVP
jgi:hypothetical protein